MKSVEFYQWTGTMKKTLYLWLCSLLVLFSLSGCGGGTCQSSRNFRVSEPFPEFLVGTWKADASRWQLTLGPDGNVVSATGSNGIWLPIAEGRSYNEGILEGEFVYMEFGPCRADYDPAKRELSVVINIDYVRIESPKGILEMDIQHYLAGQVRQDGRKWDATCWTTGGVSKTIRTDPNDIVYEALLFNKL